MKRLILLVTCGILLMPALFNSCQRETFDENLTADSFVLKNGVITINYCGAPEEFLLMADQDLPVGNVLIGNDADHIYVTFNTTGDWLLSNTKVFLGTNAAQIPVSKTGNPIRGKFTQDFNHDPYVTSFTHTFDIADLEPGQTFIIAAHADVLTQEMVDQVMVITREETAWGEGDGTFTGKAWGWYITFESKECCPNHVVVLRDTDPWGTGRQVNTLVSLGFTAGTGPGNYTIVSSANFGPLVLDPYNDLVIVSSVQSSAFYSAFKANESKFYSFVEDGGSLLWSCADYYGIPLNGAGILFPLGTTYVQSNQDCNKIPDLTLPLVSGLTTPFCSNFASHGYFQNVPGSATTYITDNSDRPTLIEYGFGNGLIMMTSITLEWVGVANPTHQQLIGRIYSYLTCAPAGQAGIEGMDIPEPDTSGKTSSEQ